MARYNSRTDLQLYDFNRCTGELSKPLRIEIEDTSPNALASGVAFSPNSRYVYVCSNDSIFQFDVTATNIPSTKIVVGIFDNYTEGGPLFTVFDSALLGPDGKIYITAAGGRKHMHIIENPNEKGLACNFKQRYFEFDVGFSSQGLPQYPNFRLGALKGSPCDTLGIVANQEVDKKEMEVKVYPNPANEVLHLSFEQSTDFLNENFFNIKIIDIMGKVVKNMELQALDNTEISTQGINSGIYYLKVDAKDGGWSKTIKIAIIH